MNFTVRIRIEGVGSGDRFLLLKFYCMILGRTGDLQRFDGGLVCSVK